MPNDWKPEFFVQRSFVRMGYELFFSWRDQSGVRHVVQPMTTAPLGDSFPTPAPAMVLKEREAQALMDEMWHAGVRPTEGGSSVGSLAATERHLADMKTIAFAALAKAGVTPGAV